METLDRLSAPPVPGAGELKTRMYRDTGDFGLVYFTLSVGNCIDSHSMPFEVCFLVLMGEGSLTVNEKTLTIRDGHTAVCPPMAERSWYNPGPGDLAVLAMKFKNRTGNGEREVETRIISEQPPAENPHGVEVRRVYESEHALSSVITLQPGEKLIRHITPVDVFFYVLEGSGLVEVGEEKKLVEKDTVIDSPKGIPHCWYNEGSETLRVLVVKVPKPTGKTQLL